MKNILVITIAATVLSLPFFAKAEPEPTAGKNNAPIFYAGPERASTGIVLVHDWFGASPFYFHAIQKLAAQGYRVAAVDLYKGQSAKNHDEAKKLMSQLNEEEANQTIDAAIATLSSKSQKLAIIGFSMGARLAIKAAVRHSDINASIVWYGETLNAPATLKKLAGPVLFIVGSRDGEAADKAANFSKASDEAGVAAEIYIYPGAAHAFAQPLFNEGKTYDPDAAALAWRISEDFLQRRLK